MFLSVFPLNMFMTVMFKSKYFVLIKPINALLLQRWELSDSTASACFFSTGYFTVYCCVTSLYICRIEPEMGRHRSYAGPFLTHRGTISNLRTNLCAVNLTCGVVVCCTLVLSTITNFCFVYWYCQVLYGEVGPRVVQKCCFFNVLVSNWSIIV